LVHIISVETLIEAITKNYAKDKYGVLLHVICLHQVVDTEVWNQAHALVTAHRRSFLYMQFVMCTNFWHTLTMCKFQW